MKRKLSWLLSVCLILQTLCVFALADSSRQFKDVENHWAKAYIEILCDHNVIDGYSNGTFLPNNSLTKAEAAKLVCVSAGITPNDAVATMLVDIEEHWGKKYIIALPVVPASSDNRFEPNSQITRAEFAEMVIGAMYLDTANFDISSLKQRFKDWTTISEETMPYVGLAVDGGIINGYEDSTFRPNNTLTRAEACVMLKRAFFADEKLKASKYYIDTVTSVSNVTQMAVAKDNTLYYVSDNKVYHATPDRVVEVWNGATNITFPTSQILQQPVISLDDPCDVDQVRTRLEQNTEASFSNFTVAGIACDYQSGKAYVMAWSCIDGYELYNDLYALILIDINQPDKVYASAFTAGDMMWEYRAGMPNGCCILIEDDKVIYSSGHEPNTYNTSYACMHALLGSKLQHH